jgi:hypothetical protein
MAVPASALLLIYTSFAEPQLQLKDYPAQNLLEEEGSTTHVRINYSAIGILDKIQTLKKVVSDLIENSIDLEHEVVEMVDRTFWELI